MLQDSTQIVEIPTIVFMQQMSCSHCSMTMNDRRLSSSYLEEEDAASTFQIAFWQLPRRMPKQKPA